MSPKEFSRATQEEVAAEFLVKGAFAPGQIRLAYSHSDRMIVGAATPLGSPLALVAGEELRAAYFLERREAGIINIGGPGKVRHGGAETAMAKGDCLYLGRGTDGVSFESLDPADPAKFYLASCPAHAAYPARKASFAEAAAVPMGSRAEANERVIRKYIHPDAQPSCQLVMGMTTLAEGSVWNTMPCHTHERRMEAYLYFGMAPKAMVFHMMGRPDETKHVIVREGEIVISPSWSIHSGVGTSSYTFIWAMAGENQAFGDMDAVDPLIMR
jgi:4-deoxy-L-threo-5-hexosulose-uronate ketol-isomerase